VAALVQAHLLGTLGPVGLRSTSLYDDQRDEAATSDEARRLRRSITAVTDRTWAGRTLDAEKIRTRLDLEVALAWSAFVKGEGFAVRVQRGKRSAWRLVDALRIKNPKDDKGGQLPNSATLRDGFRIDADGAVDGVWVVRAKLGRFGMPEDEKAMFVPWYAADGTPNIIHRVGYRLPGMMRGVSRLAPMVIMARQLAGVLESHVAAKRLQAVHAMIVEAQDPTEYKKAMASGSALGSEKWQVNGPLNVWIKPAGSAPVVFTDPKFNGLDLEAYLKITYKVQCASVQVPVDVVLCQMGEASLSSARAGLDQFDRTCQAEQERHIAEATAPIDRAAITDAEVAGDLLLPDDVVIDDALAAKYARPPKYSTDRLKDANTIEALRKAGVSGTTSFAMFGLVYEDERELTAVESEFDAAQGTAIKKDAAFIERVKTAAAGIEQSGQADLSWPIVLAAGAAETAPGAFIAALAKPEATGAASSEPGQPATPATAPAQTAAPATEGQTAPAATWWRRAIARISGHRTAA
jgi:capsid protein